MERLIREAVSQGAVYVQTPEMTGAIQKDRAALKAVLKDEKGDIVVLTAAKLARELGIYVHVGSTAIARPDGKIANRGSCLRPMASASAPMTRSTCSTSTWTMVKAGAKARPMNPARRRVSRTASGDIRVCHLLRRAFPSLFRTEAVAGAEILTVPAAFTRQTGEAHWEVLLRARAIENGAFLIAAAQAGTHEDGRETFGHSMIIDPWGNVLAVAGGEGEEIVFADIDPSAVTAARSKIPNLKNARDFNLETVRNATAAGGGLQ